ncbi:hypothetical protein Ancab_033916 [Ancistrocladus abbreviatus]
MGKQHFDMGLRLWSLSTVLLVFCLLQFSGTTASAKAANNVTAINIGVIVNENSRIGKEQKVAVQIAADNFNSKSDHLKLSLHLRNSDGNPLQAASAAVELAKGNEVKAILGMETWQEAALVAQVGNQYQLPILSLAVAPATLPLAPRRWPFLLQMASNYSQQLKCISAIVKYYNWRRVIAVYEDDGYAGTSLMLDLLSQSLQAVGAAIEHHLALPPFHVVSNPKEVVLEELVKVFSTQSRVFVVLQPSLPLAIRLFQQAKYMGLIGRETAWIFTDSISGLLHSVNTTVISYMEGALAVKTYYSETSKEYLDFFYQFRLQFPDKLNPQPGIHAARAHDAVTAIINAIEQLGNASASSKKLLQCISSSNFNGLSGNISFKGGELSHTQVLRVINVVEKDYKKLDFWTPENGFSKSLEIGGNGQMSNETKVLHGVVKWPGHVKDHVPIGWAMSAHAKPMKIGVPGDTVFKKFVKVETTANHNRTTYSGFCIDVFLEVVKILEENYDFPYELEPFYGTYDELVHCVYNKTYDAVVGDVTILANRSELVDFTQAYAMSGLSMVVPLRSHESQKALLFMKPFTPLFWLVIGATLAYTTFTVWALEHQLNPDFQGPVKKQLNATLSFIFSSIFFAHKERIQSNYTRIVVVVWLLVVFVLVQSYTANLTSMLTVPLLGPKISDLDQVKENDMIVGCDGDSFVRDYLINVLRIQPENIHNVSKEYYYPDFFDNGTIAAAFLELPYERVFLNRYCKSFTNTKKIFTSFEGLGFAFQKGSPIVADVSKAILRLAETGVLKALEDKWFSPSVECAASSTDNDVESLSIQGFWVLYLFSGASSTTCFLLFLTRLLKDYTKEITSPSNVNNTFREQLTRLWRYYDRGLFRTARVSHTLTLSDWTPQWGYASPAETSEHYPEPPSHHSTPSQLEMSDRSRQQHQVS